VHIHECVYGKKRTKPKTTTKKKKQKQKTNKKQPTISFKVNSNSKCEILTGENQGGH
jgi:hypothetical protein